MLALMPDQPTRSPMNSELESILLDEAITPLALLPLTEDEQVLHHTTHWYWCVLASQKMLVWAPCMGIMEGLAFEDS